MSELKIPEFHTMVCGPAKSGKKSLVASFVNELAWHDRNDNGFHYKATSLADGAVLEEINPFLRPDLMNRYQDIQAQRVSKVNSPRNRLSAHTHRVSVEDWETVPRGDLTTNIILCLPAEPVETDSEAKIRRVIDSFPRYSQGLLGICLTMVDRGKLVNKRFDGSLSIQRAVELIYGPSMLGMLESYKRPYRCYFATSNAGYQDIDRKSRSNYDDATGALKYPHIWHSFQASEPFFCMFQNSEINFLSKPDRYGMIRSDYYVRYPSIQY